eukprot:802515-Pyramimonas_sp.AAC.1
MRVCEHGAARAHSVLQSGACKVVWVCGYAGGCGAQLCGCGGCGCAGTRTTGTRAGRIQSRATTRRGTRPLPSAPTITATLPPTP